MVTPFWIYYHTRWQLSSHSHRGYLAGQSVHTVEHVVFVPFRDTLHGQLAYHDHREWACELVRHLHGRGSAGMRTMSKNPHEGDAQTGAEWHKVVQDMGEGRGKRRSWGFVNDGVNGYSTHKHHQDVVLAEKANVDRAVLPVSPASPTIAYTPKSSYHYWRVTLDTTSSQHYSP